MTRKAAPESCTLGIKVVARGCAAPNCQVGSCCVTVAKYYLQRMKTKWGSCNHAAGNIRLNTELVKKPKDLLEYIIVHEMAHLVEPTHNERFVAILDNHYPIWREARDDLNALPSPTKAGRFYRLRPTFRPADPGTMVLATGLVISVCGATTSAPSRGSVSTPAAPGLSMDCRRGGAVR